MGRIKEELKAIWLIISTILIFVFVAVLCLAVIGGIGGLVYKLLYVIFDFIDANIGKIILTVLGLFILYWIIRNMNK